MKKNIVVESTLYSLFIFWAIKGLDNDTTYILDSELDSSVVKEIQNYGKVYLFNSMMKQNPIKKLIYLHIWEKLKLFLYIRNDLRYSYIYGNDHFVGFDLFRKYKYNLLEDGIGNYKIIYNGFFFRKIANFIIRGFCYSKPYGISKNCTTIYLTGLTNIPDEIKHKTKIINLQKLWEEKNITEQNKILEIFNFNKRYLDTLRDKTIYLLTQPLSEDGFMTEKEKIDIYKKIITVYNLNDIVIRPHPREKTNYEYHFNNICIFNSPMPFEIFCFINTNIKKVITLFSASALGLDKSIEVEWLGHYGHSKLKNLRVNIDNLNPKTTLLKSLKD